MDKAALLEKIKQNNLTPKGSPSHEQAKLALEEIQALGELKDLDPKARSEARQELLDLVATYRRTLKQKRWLRKKRTRG